MPEIALLDDIYASGSAGDGFTPVFPTSTEDRSGIFAPNLQFETSSSIPAPATAWLLSFGIVSLIRIRKKSVKSSVLLT